MEQIPLNPFQQDLETLISDSSDSMVCDPSSRLIPTGFRRSESSEEYVLFVNAGGEDINEAYGGLTVMGDSYFEGGNILRTNEQIAEAGDCPIIYQSARLGNFSYRFDNLPRGDYIVDLHFVEIINTNGPKGIRVFNVYIQEEKVLSELDIFAVVGANKPLRLIDSRVSVKDDGVILIRFESINGSPVVSGICIRRATKELVPQVTCDYIKCNYCAGRIEVPSSQLKAMQTKSTAKYEKKIEELTLQCQLKAKECHEAWMSLTATNEQLETVRMELDNVTFKTLSLDQTVEKQAETLRNISSSYDHDKKKWTEAIRSLQEKIKLMKSEHTQLSCEAHECVNSIPEINKMVFAVQELVKQCEDFKLKYNEEMAQRKRLFNEVQEAKGNIRVFCRCRPMNKDETSAGCTTVVDFDAAKDGCLGILTGGSTKKTFRFDRVYTPKDDQVDVFSDASAMVISVLDGYNVCIFAYGQTGTGKTFTMEGTEQNRGVNYRTLEHLFEIAKERSETFAYEINVSVLEVYNEQIRDLLASGPSSKKLEIKQVSEGSHHVPGVVEAQPNNIEEAWSILQTGSNARAVGSNNVNEHSSRSHCMLCITVKTKNLINGECTKSKLWLVDLAGSERLAKTDVQGVRLKEAQNINKSLSALGDVISALASKSSHIPYRNSKLTHLLQDSLGGDSKALMFVQISPSDQDLSETLSSLNFATRVRGVEMGPVKKQIDTSELQKVKAMLEKARNDCRTKDDSIRKLEENQQNLESKAKGKDNVHRNLQETIKELECQIDSKIVMQKQLERQLLELSNKLKGKDETCNALQHQVKELEKKLKDKMQSETASLQQKVWDLDNKLKEQVRESESQSAILKDKVKELERKLKEQEQDSENLLHQKVKEVEDRYKERELKWQQQTHNSVDAAKATPVEIKYKTCTGEDYPSENEPHILRSSNSINQSTNRGSGVSLRGNDSINQMRSKREHRSIETENNFIDRKVMRKSDPPRVGRFVRATASRPVMAAPQAPLTHKRVSRDRDQVQGIKERDNKKKIWSR
ncbi:hypothetical protein QN277_028541 [Acacia crassicarpa]|uniref:Kinesin motor domain-containing protein n=1 Tax=Acacia crassicarpa TaxID=499986 RepID=A0AAE1MF89_9FABA|nr:hypothetical protein QN277_028541 [Acacia crassicarpa]